MATNFPLRKIMVPDALLAKTAARIISDARNEELCFQTANVYRARDTRAARALRHPLAQAAGPGNGPDRESQAAEEGPGRPLAGPSPHISRRTYPDLAILPRVGIKVAQAAGPGICHPPP